METIATGDQRFTDIARKLGAAFAERAATHDSTGRFVFENYQALKEHRLFSAGVPKELGGGGASHRELCEMLRELAHACGSTALALSMHTHLVAATVWRHRHGQPVEALLRKVAQGELVLVSSGAGDWVDSVGTAERVEGGYKVTATKRFCSGAPAGDLLITSAPCEAEVIVFPVALKGPGVTLLDDWDTLGMRATGSQSIELKDVFVPEASVSVRRPRGEWHPSWSVTMTVAPPIYMAAYVGVAEQAAQEARAAVASRAADPITLSSLGELENELTVVQLAFADMIALANDYDFAPSPELASRTLVRKTLLANAAIATVKRAVELVGGSAFYRRLGLERLLRDVQAAHFHPLPEKKQHLFTARVALGLPPV